MSSFLLLNQATDGFRGGGGLPCGVILGILLWFGLMVGFLFIDQRVSAVMAVSTLAGSMLMLVYIVLRSVLEK